MAFMDQGSIPRAKALMKEIRNDIQLADDLTTGEEVIAALAAVAGECIAGQEDERASHELLGMLIVATHIAVLKHSGLNIKGLFSAKA